MTRRQKDPLRRLTDEERAELERVSRAQRAPAEQVIRAKLLLAVAGRMNYTQAAARVGRRSNDAVSQLVSRFNHDHRGRRSPAWGRLWQPLWRRRESAYPAGS